VPDGVAFMVADAAQVTSEAPFDLVTIFEALHDMGDPVGALRAARERLAELRAPTLARWAAAAGFTGFEVLGIDNPFWRASTACAARVRRWPGSCRSAGPGMLASP
jgi:hypothetical protein